MRILASKLSTFWIFVTLNYLYCDVVSLMDSSKLRGFLNGSVGGMDITQQFLLAAGALVEVPMAMVLVSRLSTGRVNSISNIAAGAFMTAVQLATLLAGKPAPYYIFFSAVEIATTAAIVSIASLSLRSQPRTAGVALRRLAGIGERGQA